MTRRLSDDQRDLAEAVWTAYRPFVEAVARRHLADQADSVPDVVQNVGLVLCRHLNGFRGNGGLRTWIFRVTLHEALRVRRQESRHGRIVEALSLEPAYPDTRTPHEHLETKRTIQDVREALASLKPAHQEILRDDLDGPGLYMSERGKRSTRHRARKELRRLIGRSQFKAWPQGIPQRDGKS